MTQGRPVRGYAFRWLCRSRDIVYKGPGRVQLCSPSFSSLWQLYSLTHTEACVDYNWSTFNLPSLLLPHTQLWSEEKRNKNNNWCYISNTQLESQNSFSNLVISVPPQVHKQLRQEETRKISSIDEHRSRRNSINERSWFPRRRT